MTNERRDPTDWPKFLSNGSTIQTAWNDSVEPIVAIAEAVDRVTSEAPLDRDPIERCVDVDALSALLTAAHLHEETVSIAFTCRGVWVVAESTGRVTAGLLETD